MRQHKSPKVIVLVLFVLVSLPDPSKTGIPSDQIRQTADKVLLILQDPRLKAADKKKQRRDQLRQVISARFDFIEMAKRSLAIGTALDRKRCQCHYRPALLPTQRTLGRIPRDSCTGLALATQKFVGHPIRYARLTPSHDSSRLKAFR